MYFYILFYIFTYKIKRATTTVALFEERNMKRKIFANINAFALMI